MVSFGPSSVMGEYGWRFDIEEAFLDPIGRVESPEI
jgi:hypothetical protein